MKPLRTKPGLMICLAVSALFSGCAHKKPQVATPTAEQQAPQTVQQPAPEPTPAEAQPQTSAAPTQGTPPPAPEQPLDEKTEKTKPKNGKQHAAAKKNGQPAPAKSTQETAHNVSPRIVVKSDDSAAGPTPGVISPGPNRPDSPRDQATTEQLLQSVEANLNGIKRQLSSDEQAIVTQIRDYVNQSRQATKENDAVRAHNLALKAQLLSDDLARRR